ncbi:MAG: glutamate synthase, partial [Pseudomonadota bacterium]
EGALDADLVLLAMGFSGPPSQPLIEDLDMELVARGRFKGLAADDHTYHLNDSKSGKWYAAGDIRRGQSLVVWAIREGRQAAHAIDKALMGATTLPR